MIVELCVHGEAKPHQLPTARRTTAPYEWQYQSCPGGRVLQQAIIIERDTDGEWPEWAIDPLAEGDKYDSADIEYARGVLDALASAQENQ